MSYRPQILTYSTIVELVTYQARVRQGCQRSPWSRVVSLATTVQHCTDEWCADTDYWCLPNRPVVRRSDDVWILQARWTLDCLYVRNPWSCWCGPLEHPGYLPREQASSVWVLLCLERLKEKDLGKVLCNNIEENISDHKFGTQLTIFPRCTLTPSLNIPHKKV